MACLMSPFRQQIQIYFDNYIFVYWLFVWIYSKFILYVSNFYVGT